MQNPKHQLELWPKDGPDVQYNASDYIVLSLQQNAWLGIRDGVKRFEYRRRFRNSATVAFIYVSDPASCICGVVSFARPIFGTAREIADLAEGQIAGNGTSVHSYLEHGNRGCAVPVIKLKCLPPLKLEYLRTQFGFVAPQLYFALDRKPHLFAFLVEHAQLGNLQRPTI